MNAGACPWLLTHLADSIQRDIQTETIGTMTDARSKMAQHFYVARPLVATTRMLLRCKPFHRSWTVCLSMYLFYHKEGKPEMEQNPDAQTPKKDSAFLPAHECGGLLPRFSETLLNEAETGPWAEMSTTPTTVITAVRLERIQSLSGRRIRPEGESG